MAYAQVENGVVVHYHGIVIYHTYKNNFIENVERNYRFTLEPFGSEDDDDTFDIRDMQGYDASKSVAANLVQMIDAHLLGDLPDVGTPVTDKNDPYSAANTLADICPVCGTEIRDYGVFEILDEQVRYPFICSNCQVSGSQWGSIIFNGYTLE